MSEMGIQRFKAQLVTPVTLTAGQRVNFDIPGSVPYDTSTTIVWDNANTQFNLFEEGDYYITWWCTVKTGLSLYGASFELNYATTTGAVPAVTPKVVQSNNSMKTGQLSGDALVRVPAFTDGTTPSMVVYLTNSSGAPITFATNTTASGANTPVIAGITIIKVPTPDMAGAIFEAISPQTSLAEDASIIFDQVDVYDTDTTVPPTFAWDGTNAAITINRPGRYLVDWSASFEGSADINYIELSLEGDNNANPTTVVGVSQTPINIQESAHGFSYIDVPLATNPSNLYYLQLVNTSTPNIIGGIADLTYAAFQPIKASMRIVSLD